ncbi:MAG TPA: nitroreductase family protein [Gemmatimonadales bacterium]|nr:nitroreductase family protein [Gemmatimonadales bacterium]
MRITIASFAASDVSAIRSEEDDVAAHVELERQHGTLDAIYQRRAVRSYTPDKLDKPTIRRLLDAAVHAPTAMHLEPWTFVVIQDVALLARLSERGKILAREEATRHLLADPNFNIFYDASTLIVICGKPLGGFVTADCWLAAENLMLAACALGLGTCCIGFAVPVLNAPEVKRELGIPTDVTAVAPIIVGVPRGVTPPVPRRPPEVLRWIR